MDNQINLFEVIYPKYKITKPIRLIELFSGYGSQALALKYLGVEFEHWKICEWAVKSIQAYKDIHFTDKEDNWGNGLTKEEISKYLYLKGISNNYNEPMTLEQINRLNEKQLRTILNNIFQTHNLVNIQQVKGEDLEIKDTDKYDYILTYSFPCQDLSLAGKGKGMSDTSTRSGMLWEVERILQECQDLGELPQILLMENVPQVHSQDNLEDFNKWKYRLEELGYKNYFQDLIATDYGIPQTRNRCFMVSILGDYSYTFPKPIPLKLKLKDMLEDKVDEKYYLSDKMKQYIFSEDDKYKVNKNSLKLNRDIACSKTTREGWTRADTSDYITDEIINTYDEYNHKVNGNETIGTIQAMYPVPNHGHRLIIKNATSKGYLEATEGDEIDISSRMEYHRGNVQKDKIQTITTSGGNDRGVVIGTYQYSKSDKFMHGKDRLQLGKETSDTLQTTQKEGVVTIGNYMPSKHNASRIVDKEHCSPTVTENHGTVTAIVDNSVYSDIEKKLFTKDGNIKRYINSNIIDEFKEGQMATTTFPNGYGHGPRTHDKSIALNTIDKPSVKQNLRIRKLTPRECGRLMGVKDDDITNMLKNQSDSSAYHCFGDSIVVNVLMAIFKELF